MYSQKIMQHFVNPQNVGTLKKPDAVGKCVDEVNGDIVKIYLTINNDDFTIENATFKTLGSPIAIACSDLACNMIKGKQLVDAENIDNVDLINFVGSGEIPVDKVYSISVVIGAIKDAVKIFKKKILNEI